MGADSACRLPPDSLPRQRLSWAGEERFRDQQQPVSWSWSCVGSEVNSVRVHPPTLPATLPVGSAPILDGYPNNEQGAIIGNHCYPKATIPTGLLPAKRTVVTDARHVIGDSM